MTLLAGSRLFAPARPEVVGRHPTVPVLYTPPAGSEPSPWGPGREARFVDVDEGLAGLILELWSAGIATTGSCQGASSVDAVICFGGQDDARRFMRAVLDARRHMVSRQPISLDRWTAQQWHTSIRWNHGDNPSVAFPHHEIGELEARLRWWNRWAPAPWYQLTLGVSA